MSGPFNVGDVVVRVGSPRRFIGPRRPPPMYHPIRVDQIAHDCFGEQGVVFTDYPSNHPLIGWWSGNYRHLPKADEQFTAQIRACKPIRKGVPA